MVLLERLVSAVEPDIFLLTEKNVMNMSRKGTMTFLGAAKAILEEMKVPMHFKKITELAIQRGILRSSGKTPEWTMGARISVDIKHKGADSDFIRVDSGRYGLRRWKRGRSAVAGLDNSLGGPRYWLVCAEPQNFVADLENNSFDTIGVKQRMLRTLEKLSPGDKVVVYIKRQAQFGAILEVTGSAEIDSSPRWPVLNDDYSARVSCKPLKVLRGDRIDARPLYSRLEVFTQYPSKHRTLALRNGITEFSKSDFEIIAKSMAEY